MTLLVFTLLGTRAPGQSSYTMYYQSGPPETMHAGSSSTGFEVPIERTMHSFSFSWRFTAGATPGSGSTYPMGFVTSGTGVGTALRSLLVTAYTPPSYTQTPYTYSYNGGTYTTYTYTTTPFACVEWWLVDTTASQSTAHFTGTPAQNADLRTVVWTPTGAGTTSRYFAIPAARDGHSLVAGSVPGGWTTVGQGSYKFGTYANGTSGAQLLPTFFIGYTPAGAGDFSLADCTEGKIAPLNQTNVLASTWQYDSTTYPMTAVTIYLPATETRYRYVLRWQLPNQPQGATSLLPGTQATAISSTATVNAGTRAIPAGAAKITGSIPNGANFWITRSIDSTESPTPGAAPFQITAALAASTTPKIWWVEKTAPNVTWSTKTFGIRATEARLGQTFTISQPSSISETIPAPAAAGAAPTRTIYHIQDYASLGQDNTFDYFLITGQVNSTAVSLGSPPETVHLLADGVEVSPTAEGWLYDGWTWIGGSPAPAPPVAPGEYEFSLSLTGPRASHLFTLTAPDGTVSETVASIEIFPQVALRNQWHPTQTWTTGQARWIFPKPYNGLPGDWKFNDFYDPSLQTLHVGTTANYAQDFGYWRPSQRPLQLKISGSRWTSDGPQRLQLRQADDATTTAQIISNGSVQWISPDHTGTIWTNSNYLFYATTTIREGVPYWLYDEDTDEESPQITSTTGSADFTTWFALPRPFPLNGSVDAAGIAHLQWPLPPLAANEGAFQIERKAAGQTTWTKLPIPPAPPILPADADGSGILYFSENLAALVGSANTLPAYRVRYAFGNPLHTSAPSNIVNLDWFNGTAPELVIVSGDQQLGEPGALLKDALVVRVTLGGTARQNAPVTFAIASGGGALATSATGAGATTLPVTTDADGQASVRYHLPTGQSLAPTITATPGTASAAAKRFSVFGDSDLDGMSDVWEDAHGFNKLDWRDASADADGDGISNLDEFKTGANPRDPPGAYADYRGGLDDVTIHVDDASSVTLTDTASGTAWTRYMNYASRLGDAELVSAAKAPPGMVEFHTMLKQGGWYRVFLWHNASINFSNSVPVTITHADTSIPTVVNFNEYNVGSGGKWDLLGTFRFTNTAEAKVLVRKTQGVGVTVGAVRFARIEPNVVLSANPASTASLTAPPPPPPPGDGSSGEPPPGPESAPAPDPLPDDFNVIPPAADEPTPADDPSGGAPPPPPPEAALAPATSSGVTLSGSWKMLSSVASLTGQLLQDDSNHATAGDVTFVLSAPAPGDYDVYVWFPLKDATLAAGKQYASEVNVSVKDAGGAEITLSVKTGVGGVPVLGGGSRMALFNEGRWVRFPRADSFRYKVGTPFTVKIANRYGGGANLTVPENQIVAADSVRLVKVSKAEYVVDNEQIVAADRTGSWSRINDPFLHTDFGWSSFSAPNTQVAASMHLRATLGLPGNPLDTKATQPGIHDVWMWWPASTTFSNLTPVSIGTQSLSLNQRVNGGRWNFLTHASFASASAEIILSNYRSTNTGASVADAVLVTRDRDTDDDGIDDAWELKYFSTLDVLGDTPEADYDHDGLTDREEFRLGTDPTDPDSDHDGMSDRWEANYPGMNPKMWNDSSIDSDGDGSTNLEEAFNGSDPSNPNNGGANDPKKLTVSVGTATLDGDVTQKIYPSDDSQLLLKNGNFSAPAISNTASPGDGSSWETYAGITGWSAMVGSLIELQAEGTPGSGSQRGKDGQLCELDSHWPASAEADKSDHGIKQTVNLARGGYLLIFDYKGRQGSDGFKVTLKPELPGSAAGAETALISKTNADTSAWHRASVSLQVSGGDPSQTTLPFSLRFDINDAADSLGTYVDSIILLPVEVNCPELYMFSGHSGDKVELCKVTGITCEWKLKNAAPVIGTFDHPTDTACSFTATAPGKNTIQLLVGGKVAWEKPTEILDLKSRATWGAKPVDIAHMDGTMPTIAGATFHHSANTNDGIAEIQRIQNEHQANGIYYFTHENWGDIAYHFVMTKDGTVYVGRELEAAPGSAGGPYTLGAHVKKKNTPSGIGLCMLGNYDTEAFTAAHQKDLEKALAAICRRYKLTWDKVSFHSARAAVPPVYETTACPGANVTSKAKEISDHVKENLQ